MNEILICLGAFIIFSGAIGLARFEDAFERFHPPTKISLLGLSLIFLGMGTISLFIGTLVLLLAAPLAAHILAKALFGRSGSKR